MEETAQYMFPTSQKEVKSLGWDYIDVILFTGDAFIDHPSFGAAVIARVLQREGYRVAVVPQPNWRDDLRDFKKLGVPRLFFAVSSGAMDSMVNHYTANKRLRSDDAYTPDGKAGQRPDYAVKVYSEIIKGLYPDVPLVIGGIEASLRRFCHYDYWQDRLLPSILQDSGADYLVYGMGERSIIALARHIAGGSSFYKIIQTPQIAYLSSESVAKLSRNPQSILLNSYEKCLEDKGAFVDNFNIIETEANKMYPKTLLEPTGDRVLVVNPPFPPATTQEIDSYFDLPYTKLPHPRYKGKRIPAYDMIKNSINIHRGCFGGCSFCTIAAHQGRFIQSRSEESIIREISGLVKSPEFKGVISDIGAPTANMYGMRGKDPALCETCSRKSCLTPVRCRNLNHSHALLLDLYSKINSIPGVRKSFIGSGIRYDLFLDEKGWLDDTSRAYFRELVLRHTSGRLKVAPEHTEDHVLKLMSKPSFRLFVRLKNEFDKLCSQEKYNCQIVPYFISSHPGCSMKDMERLAANPALKGVYMDQVQDFTPTPMTASSAMFYSGMDLKTKEKIFVERSQTLKKKQKSFFFKKS